MLRCVFTFLILINLHFSLSGQRLDSLLQTKTENWSDSLLSVHFRDIGMSFYYERGNLDSSLIFLERSLVKAEKSRHPKLIIKAKNAIGLMYREKGIYDKSLQNYLQGLQRSEEVKDSFLIGSSLMGIAVVHHIQKNYQKAKEYYDRSFQLNTAFKNKAGLQSYYNNVGLLYFHQEKYDSALIYYDASLQMAIELNDRRGVATCNENIGLIYLYDLKNYAKAIGNFEQSLKMWRKDGDINSVSITLNYMAHALMENGQIAKAIDTAAYSIKLAKDVGSISAQRDGWELLHRIYLKKNDFKNSLESFKNYIKLKDSLVNNEKTGEITALQVRYEENKKRIEDSLQMATANKFELEKRELLLDQKSIQTNWMIVGLVLLLILVLVVFLGYRNKQKANVLIEEQKRQVEERNREITASIVYAKHIQDSILPDEQSFRDFGLHAFVYYQPKDIVAGDFYWMHSLNDAIKNEKNVLFTVGDCTGHGVPGALVSVMCNQAIKQAVRDFPDQDPAFILDKINDLVNTTFYRGNSGVYDGMDISFCKIDQKSNKLFFAGANNAIVIVRSNEIIELKGDKQPIGKHPARRNFTSQIFQLEKEDMLYLFSDGFSDQFGGEKRKKLKYNNFKKILVKASMLAIEKQKNFLEKEFEDWRGNLEQVDDVCVLGIRIS